MCGIYLYNGSSYSYESLKDSIDKIKYRGPDNSKYSNLDENVLFAFHRLSIVGLSETGNQPLIHPEDDSLVLICNGEIYNYKDLAQKYNFNLKTGSDCEIILHMFKLHGIEKTVSALDGVFMFVLYDMNSKIIYASRDPFGVRPGFIGYNQEELFISSEAKPLIEHCDKIIPFEPGTWWTSRHKDRFNKFFNIESDTQTDINSILNNVNNLFKKSVKKRLMAEREIGCLLSGGLDSSLVAALVSKYYSVEKLNTFSIGMPGSIDLHYAKQVADYIQSNHHHVEISEQDFLDSIEKVIYNIESYDITTVRASVGNYLVSKYISENTDCKVIFNGDGSDEVCCGYFYLKNAPNGVELQDESRRLIDEIHMFDVLRSDRSISSNGLEPRTPFLDKNFVKYYHSINPELKKFDGSKKIEKYILRKAFEKDNLLPEEILWRNKCAFSDGVSSENNSWHNIIKKHFDTIVSDEELSQACNQYKHCTPLTKESYYYRKIFNKFFKTHDNIIPHFWMPRWTEAEDPSAREISDYSE